MLTQRLTKPFKVVSLSDEATLDINDKVFSLYAQTRDFSLIEELIPSLEIKPTIFHCLPLMADKEYLADSMLTNPSGTAWNIFRHHVKSAENFTDNSGNPLIKIDPETELIKQDCHENIPSDVIKEIAGVIIHKANESTKPFIMPDTWLRTRIRSRVVHAMLAKEETVNEPDTK